MVATYDPTVQNVTFDTTEADERWRVLSASNPAVTVLDAWFGGFSAPSKMPGLSYNLPALVTCKIGAILNKQAGTVCEKCYATRGRYTFPACICAMARRLAALKSSTEMWAASIALRISTWKGKCDKVFRFHDSGEVVSLGHLLAIAWIAARCPDWKFWLPTREVGIVAQYLKENEAPSNLCIRVSAMRVDSAPPIMAHPEIAYSAVHTNEAPEGYGVCPAPKQEGKCADCRNCWDRSKNVSYHVH